MKARISLSNEERDRIYYAVSDAVRYYPNSHLGDCTPREDIRSAFKMLRSWADQGIWVAIGELERNVSRYVDM